MAVPYTFGSATSAIPLSQLDSNFATTITLGNTAIQLGNTVTTLNNMTLANVTISSGNVTITNVSVTTANVTTLNAATVIATTGNITTVNATTVVATTANATTANITTGNLTDLNLTNNPTFSGGTANGVLYLNGSKVATSGSALTFDGSTFGVTGAATVTGDISTTSTGRLNVRGSGTGINYDLQIDNSDTLVNFRASRSNAVIKSYAWYLDNSVTEQMRLTSTGLGIGTSSPATKLHISGSTTPNLRFEQTNSSVVHQFQAASGNFFLNIDATNAIGGSTFLIQQAGSTVATLSSTGNLGLGVTPSAWGSGYRALQVGGSGVDIWTTSAAGGNLYLSNNVYFDGTNRKYIANAVATEYEAGSVGHVWKIAASGTAGNAISFTQAMTLTAAGKLAIANTSPGTTLAVGSSATGGYDGGVYLNRGAGVYNFYEASDGTNTVIFGLDHTLSAAKIGTINSYPIAFYTGNAERARIDSSGNLLVGSTSALLSSSNRGNITLNGTTDSLMAFGSGGTAYGYIQGTTTAFNISAYQATTPIIFYTNGTERARIDSSGNLNVGATGSSGGGIQSARIVAHKSGSAEDNLIECSLASTTNSYQITFWNGNGLVGAVLTNGSATTYATSSDYRLKTLVGAVTGAGERIDALQPVEFDWKVNGKRARGFFADKFQEVYPDSVTGEKDAVDAEGKPVYQSMQASTSEVIADLVAELQSLRKRVAQLEGK